MRAGWLLVLIPQLALAEASWLSTRGRLEPELQLAAFVGTRSFGAGLVRADAVNPRTGLAVEGVVGFVDRTVEVRAERLWQLTERRLATAALAVGGAAFLVPDRLAPDFGTGPHAQLSLSLGGRVFAVELSLQTGVEVFARGGLRFPQRAGLGLHLRLGDFVLAAMSRLGADLFIERSFLARGEVALSVGWLGLDVPR